MAVLARRIAMVCAGAFLVTGLNPGALSAQTPADRAAWDGLILSPIGALAPIAREPSDEENDQSEVWLRYGRWRYDADDAIHNNTGITVFRRVDFLNSELSLTGGYLSLSCSTCASWVLGGVGLQSPLWQGEITESASASLTLRTDVGGAHYFGDYHAAAISAASAVVIGVSAPSVHDSRIAAAISPGYGVGRMYFAGGVHSGARPMVGAALTWTLASGLAMNLGVQRIVIPGGPTQAGLGVGWTHQ